MRVFVPLKLGKKGWEPRKVHSSKQRRENEKVSYS